MGRIRTGPIDSPRNRIIYDLARKGLSTNKISKELLRRGFDISQQRVHQILTSKKDFSNAAKETTKAGRK